MSCGVRSLSLLEAKHQKSRGKGWEKRKGKGDRDYGKKHHENKVKQYLMFAGVSTVLFCAGVILPFIYGLYLTFTSWDGVSKDKPFVGLANYIATFQDAAYWQALGRTLIYSVIAVILVNVVAFFLAYLLTSGIEGRTSSVQASSYRT